MGSHPHSWKYKSLLIKNFASKQRILIDKLGSDQNTAARETDPLCLLSPKLHMFFKKYFDILILGTNG